ncbi:TPA: hypothetical protein ACFNMI_000668 [Neisseria bacilliformis]
MMDVYLNIDTKGTVVLTIGQPMRPADQWLVCPFEEADFPEEIARAVEREAGEDENGWYVPGFEAAQTQDEQFEKALEFKENVLARLEGTFKEDTP